MNDVNITYILIALGILLSIPFTYVQAFLIIELKKKVGRLKFTLILFGYIIIVVAIVQLLATGSIGLIALFVLPLIINIFGIYYLKDEFIQDMKKLFRNSRSG